MIGIVKKLAIELLKRSGRPELVEVANWLIDAEQAAVDAIMRILSAVMRGGGDISDEASKDIIAAKASLASKPKAAPQALAPGDSEFVREYAAFMRQVATVGSWRTGLLLQGFLHSRDVSSLWVFDPLKEPNVVVQKELTGTREDLIVMNSDRKFNIYLLPKVSDEEFLAINKKLGRGRNLPAGLDLSQRVAEIYEDRIVAEQKGGTKKEFDIEDNDGVDEMINTFEEAVRNRDSSLKDLKEKLNRPDPPP